jgi:NCS2 family nucleobase:cation symporter-2
MILAGVQVITSRMLDARRIFVVGIALVFGLSVDMVPGLYRDVPHHLQPIFSSSLALSTVMVVLLNLLFRMGVTKRQAVEFTPGKDGSRAIFEFLETHGAEWGARRDVVTRAASALNEFVESAANLGFVKGRVRADVSFDEFNLDVDIRYEGDPMDFPVGHPTHDAIAAETAAVVSLSGFLIRQYADGVKTSSADGRCRVQLHFDH